jgi:ketosteroid isomerase-like protein
MGVAEVWAMSGQENMTIVRQVYDGFVQKDLNAILALQAEDAVWSVAGPQDQIPWAAPRRGHEGVADFLKTLGGWLKVEKFEIHDYLASDEKVVALGDQSGLAGPAGKRYAFDFVHVWTLRAGLVTSFRVYYDTTYVASLLQSEPS